jgi:hypothetical protein
MGILQSKVDLDLRRLRLSRHMRQRMIASFHATVAIALCIQASGQPQGACGHEQVPAVRNGQHADTALDDHGHQNGFDIVTSKLSEAGLWSGLMRAYLDQTLQASFQ